MHIFPYRGWPAMVHQVYLEVSRLRLIPGKPSHGNLLSHLISSFRPFAWQAVRILPYSSENAAHCCHPYLLQLNDKLRSDFDFAETCQVPGHTGQSGSETFGADEVEALSNYPNCVIHFGAVHSPSLLGSWFTRQVRAIHQASQPRAQQRGRVNASISS